MKTAQCGVFKQSALVIVSVLAAVCPYTYACHVNLNSLLGVRVAAGLLSQSCIPYMLLLSFQF